MDGSRFGLLALVGLLTAVVYLPVREANYVYEDASYLRAAAQPIVMNVPGRAVTLWSWRAVSASRPDRAHALQLGLHLLCGVLVFWLASLLDLPTTLSAAVFLLHPLNGQATAYLSSRADVLVTLAVLLAVCLALSRSYVLAALACLLAAMSKEIGLVAIPLVLATLGVWRPSRRLFRTALVAGVAMAGLLGPIVVGWLTMRPGTGGSFWSGASYAGYQLLALGRALALVIVPVGFTIDHDPIALSAAWALVPLVFVVGLVLLQTPLARWTLAWSAIVLLPRFVVRQPEFLNDAHCYLLMAGLSLGLATGLTSVWDGFPERTDRTWHPEKVVAGQS